MKAVARYMAGLMIVAAAWSGPVLAGSGLWTGQDAPSPQVRPPVLAPAVQTALSSRHRFAIVIGNGSGYLAKPLEKSEQDASSMAAMLKTLGFKVYGLVNANRASMDRLVQDVVAEAEKYDHAEIVFYYSGHGMQIDGENYLLPVDLPVDGDEITVKDLAYGLHRALNRLQSIHGTRIIILDACRSNPYVKGFKAPLTAGLAKIGGGDDSLIAYATASGTSAVEGSKDLKHSLFTEYLLQSMSNPKRNITDLLASTISKVKEKSDGRQKPDISTSLGDDGFYFAPGVCSTQQEQALWKQAGSSKSEEGYRNFIAACPDSDKVADAQDKIIAGQEKAELRRQLAELQAQKTAVPLPASPVSSAPVLSSPTPGTRMTTDSRVDRVVAQIEANMVTIPAGTFVMGSPRFEFGRFDDEGPQHQVNLRSFALSRFDVTFDDWDACVSDGGCNGYSPNDEGWGRGNRPVINVSWNEAQSFIRWISSKTGRTYRLPRESEWEYAARAGTTQAYYWGYNSGSDHANCDGCGSQWDNKSTSPVGSFPPNAYGLYDMAGNVWQWTADCWSNRYSEDYDYGADYIYDGCKIRINRGGSFLNFPRSVRSANRSRYSSVDRHYSLGFRLARTLP